MTKAVADILVRTIFKQNYAKLNISPYTKEAMIASSVANISLSSVPSFFFLCFNKSRLQKF